MYIVSYTWVVNRCILAYFAKFKKKNYFSEIFLIKILHSENNFDLNAHLRRICIVCMPYIHGSVLLTILELLVYSDAYYMCTVNIRVGCWCR